MSENLPPPPSASMFETGLRLTRFVLAFIGAYVVFEWLLGFVPDAVPMDRPMAAGGLAILFMLGSVLTEFMLRHRRMERFIEEHEQFFKDEDDSVAS